MLMRLRREAAGCPLAARLWLLTGLVVATVTSSCGGSTEPRDCLDDNGNSEVRIHLGNAQLTAAVTVTVMSDNETCVVNPLTTDAAEFSQVVMNAELNTEFNIQVSGAGRNLSGRTCTVNADAFTNLPPGAENGQVFATVQTQTTFFTLSCDSGWQ